MWICVKDRYGKYILNMKNYKKVICPKNKKDENGFYCIKLFPADDKDMSVTRYENEKIELCYDTYDEASQAYDYMKAQLCKSVFESEGTFYADSY
jgi:hypothetical protein